jgi:hypothetical protein
MIKFALLLCVCTAALSAQEFSTVEPSPSKGKRLWMWSLAALAAGNIADAHSSWGKLEANPVLAGAQGRFDWRSVGIKIGIQAPMVGFQLWQAHKHPSPSLYRGYTVTNFAVGGALGAVSIHNYGLSRPKPVTVP